MFSFMYSFIIQYNGYFMKSKQYLLYQLEPYVDY